jgi:hypothetical protein
VENQWSLQTKKDCLNLLKELKKLIQTKQFGAIPVISLMKNCSNQAELTALGQKNYFHILIYLLMANLKLI